MRALGTKLRSILAALIFAAVLSFTGYLNPVQNELDEFRMGQWPRSASGQVVFIGIDKNSLDAVGSWPWPRSTHAKAISKLSELGAREIAFDVDFSSPSSQGEDAQLAHALRESNAGVVLPTFLQPASSAGDDDSLVQSKPIDLFADEAWIASVNVVPDSDGLVRHLAHAIEIGGEIVPSLASVLAGAERLEVSSFPIDLSINPDLIPTYSFADLLDDTIPRSAIDGKTVLIGAHALELRDNLTVPVYGVISGPVMQILAAETLIQDRVVKNTSLLLSLVLMVLTGLVALIILPRMRLAYQMSTIVLIAVLVETASHYAFAQFATSVSSAPILIFLLLIAIIRTAGDLDVRTWLLRLAKAEAANTRLVLDQVFEDSSDAVLIIKEDGSLLEQNTQFFELFAGPDVVNEERSALDHLPQKLSDEARLAVQKLKEASGSSRDLTSRGRLELAKADCPQYVDYSITPSQVTQPVKGSDGDIETFFIASITARDVTVEVEQHDRLDYLSRFDELTGAERRNEFLKRLAARGDLESRTTIFTLGLLRFDNLVSTMGREVGDQMLRALIDKITASNRHIEGVARLDRETFVLRLAPGLDADFVSDFPYRLLADLTDPVVINRQSISVDFCMGYACESLGSEADAQRVLNQAEFALREAEQLGPNGICAFNSRTSLRQQRARELEQEMRGALTAGEFHVVYQPQVDSMTGEPIGAEALVRWTNPKFGEVSPAEFIEIAETTGVIIRIGQFVLNQACRDAMAWDDEITISVNVSPIQLSRGDVVQVVKNALKTSGLPAERLVIELTESSFIGDDDELLLKLDSLKHMGVSIVLDDFGTGYSSLGYLAHFPMDKIKVDQSFIRNIANSPNNQAIVRSIKVLADGFNIKVLCEGVETESELHVVQKLGCQEIQGYYFGKPQSIFDMIRFLSKPGKPLETHAPKFEVVQ